MVLEVCREGKEGRSISSDRGGPYGIVEDYYGGLANGQRDWGYGLAWR